jgi:cytochrome c biogenesis protein CcmG, thiol:disulfide interchange protein DsbE
MTGRRSGARRAALALPLAAVLVLAGCSSGHTAARPLPAAKSFSLKVLDRPGQQVSLAQYAGKPLVINFFASWCTPCQKETPLLARFYKSTHGKVVIIGVDANDETAPAEKFVHASDVTYPVAVDPFPAKTTTSYGVFALPQTFFLNKEHRIVKKILGDVTLTQLTKGVALIDHDHTTLAAGGQGQG